MASTSNENQLQLVFQTFERDLQLSINEAARFYNIPRTTLSARIKGRSIYVDVITNSRKLTTLKEEVVVQEVFDLDLQGFLPRIYNIKDIANRLLAIRNATYIGLHWTFNFVKRQPELCIYWNCPYNYQKVQYEDPKIIEIWFRFFQNIVIKYNIIKFDIWNFDETNFLIS